MKVSARISFRAFAALVMTTSVGAVGGQAFAQAQVTCDPPRMSREEMVHRFMGMTDDRERIMFMRMYGRGFIEVVPGFGGIYVDRADDRIVYVRLVQPDQEAAERAVDLVLGTQRAARDVREVRPVRSEYGWHQLLEWADCYSSRTPAPSRMTTLDVDEGENRVGIGVESTEDIALVEQELAALGIPREAVTIEIAVPFTFASGGDSASQSSRPQPESRDTGPGEAVQAKDPEAQVQVPDAVTGPGQLDRPEAQERRLGPGLATLVVGAGAVMAGLAGIVAWRVRAARRSTSQSE